MGHLRLVSSCSASGGYAAGGSGVGAAAACGSGFNSRDLIALSCWKQSADVHGYRRVVVEGGTADGEPEEGAYVLVYAPQNEWASFGIARSGADVVVWHCGSFADVGRFPTMLQALESLPPIWQQAAWRRGLSSRQTMLRPPRSSLEPMPGRARLTLVLPG